MLASSTVGLKLVTAAWGILVARLLGPGLYGGFAYILALIAATQIFSDAGASSYIARYVARRGGRGDLSLTLRSLIRLQTGLAFIAATILACLSAIYLDISSSTVGAVFVIVVVTALAQVGRGLLRGSGQAHHEVFLQLIGYFVLMALTLVVGTKMTVGAASWLYSLWAVPILLYSIIWALRARRQGRRRKLRKRSISAAFKATLPLNVTGSLGALWTRLDVLILGGVVTSVYVGYYSAALQVYTGIVAVAAASSVVLVPTFAAARRERPRYRILVSRWWGIYFGVGFLVGVTTLALAQWLPELLGEAYRGSVDIVRVLALGLPMVFASAVTGQALIGAGRERLSASILAACVILGVVTHLIGAFMFGVVGVALSLVFIVTIRLVMETVAVRRVTSIET